MIGGYKKKRKGTESSTYWNNVVMNPQATFQFIKRLSKPHNEQCYELPRITYKSKRNSPCSGFFKRQRQLIRQRQKTSNVRLHSNSSINTRNMERQESRNTMSANFVRLKDLVSLKKQQPSPVLRCPPFCKSMKFSMAMQKVLPQSHSKFHPEIPVIKRRTRSLMLMRMINPDRRQTLKEMAATNCIRYKSLVRESINQEKQIGCSPWNIKQEFELDRNLPIQQYFIDQ